MPERKQAARFAFPAAARFGRRLPKEKIYQHARPGNRQRQLFIRQIETIQWQYKLASETVNLPSGVWVQEIQVLDISLKPGVEELDESTLRLTDKAIPHPVYYRIVTGDREQFAMAWKRPHESNTGQWVVEDYYWTGWQQAGQDVSEETALPMVTDLDALYEALLSSLLAEPALPGEPLEQRLERIRRISRTEKQLRQLQSRLKREKQFNRKVEINSQINQIRKDLARLANDPGSR